MHAPPAFQLTVRHFGLWRCGSAGLVLTTALVVSGWAARAAAAFPVALALSVLLWVMAAVGLWVHAHRQGPVSLRWDGQVWHFGPAASVGQEPLAGYLAVMLDLGAWMLLRFHPAGERRVRWLPVQRRGHEASWHALRATVYCARPAPVPIAAPF